MPKTKNTNYACPMCFALVSGRDCARHHGWHAERPPVYADGSYIDVDALLRSLAERLPALEADAVEAMPDPELTTSSASGSTLSPSATWSVQTTDAQPGAVLLSVMGSSAALTPTSARVVADSLVNAANRVEGPKRSAPA